MTPEELITQFNLDIHIKQLPPATEGGQPRWVGSIKNQYGEAIKIITGRSSRPTKVRLLCMLIEEGMKWKSPLKRWLSHRGISIETPQLKQQWEELRNNTLQLSKMTEEKWKDVRW